MRDDSIIDALMTSSRIKNLGLRRELVVDILKTYNTILINTLLENGHVELENGMIIEIIQLLERVHVLRGTPYKGSRKYKLKLTMEEDLYHTIESYYNKLEEELL